MAFYECDMCSTIFNNSSNMRRHRLLTHSNEKKYKCEECNTFFTRSDHLQRHYHRHKKNSERLVCGIDGCKKVFYNSSKLQIHQELHTKKLDEDTTIIMGFSVTKTKLNGSFHLVCPFENCEMNFASYSGIQKHIKVHLDPEMKTELKNKSKIYSCEICDKTFDKKKRLLTHVEKFHTLVEKVEPKDVKIINGRTFFICPHEGCRKIYTTRSNLNMHTKSIHEHKVVFKCDDCGKSFKWKKSLRSHRCQEKY